MRHRRRSSACPSIRRTRRVKVERVVSAVSVGRQLSPEARRRTVAGRGRDGDRQRADRDVPARPDGPGGGRWNLDRYEVTRLPIPEQELIALPPPGNDPANARGIAE